MQFVFENILIPLMNSVYSSLNHGFNAINLLWNDELKLKLFFKVICFGMKYFDCKRIIFPMNVLYRP